MRWAIAHLAAWFFFLVFVCLFCYLIAVAGGSEKGSLPTPVVSIFSITFAAICAFLVRMSTTLANWSQEMLLNQVTRDIPRYPTHLQPCAGASSEEQALCQTLPAPTRPTGAARAGRG